MKRLGVLLLFILISSSIALAAPEGTPDATLTLKTKSFGVGAGGTTNGEGILTYKGQELPFTVRGFSLGEIGVSKSEATGKIYGLKKLEDFSGRYQQKKADVTIGVGAGVGYLSNENTGVQVYLDSSQAGVSFSVAMGGTRFTLDPEAVAKFNKIEMEPHLTSSIKALADVCGCPVYVNVYWSTYQSDPMAKKRSVGYAVDQFVSSATEYCHDASKRETFCKDVAQLDVMFDDKAVSSMLRNGDTLKLVTNERGKITPAQLADILVQ